VRFFQQAVSERLRRSGLRIAQHSGQETGDSFYRRSRGHFAAGQDEISQGGLFIDKMLGNPFVNPLISTANECDMRFDRPPIKCLLIERGAARGEENFVTWSGRLESLREWTDHEDHPGTASEGSIVNLAVNTAAESAQIDQGDIEKTSLRGPPDHADLEWPLEEFGKKRDD
jgi:hypothetical protein